MTEKIYRKSEEAREWYREHLSELLSEYGNGTWLAISTHLPEILDYDKNFSDLVLRIRNEHEHGSYILMDLPHSKDAPHLRLRPGIDR